MSNRENELVEEQIVNSFEESNDEYVSNINEVEGHKSNESTHSDKDDLNDDDKEHIISEYSDEELIDPEILSEYPPVENKRITFWNKYWPYFLGGAGFGAVAAGGYFLWRK